MISHPNSNNATVVMQNNSNVHLNAERYAIEQKSFERNMNYSTLGDNVPKAVISSHAFTPIIPEK